MTLSIVADIGGTNTRVALARGAEVLPGSLARFSNGDYKGRGQDIAHILADYLTTAGQSVTGVCVAAAGPVQNGVATMTNLDWVMDADKLTRATGATRVALLNDLQAQGHSLGHIAPSNLRTVIPGPRVAGSMLVVGLGTGVNAAPVHGNGAARVVAPSECGHVTMPVCTAEDFAAMTFIRELLTQRGETPHCGVEEVLAGRGLANLYAYACNDHASTVASAQVLDRLSKAESAAITAATIYTRILGKMLADLALIHLPYGGIYLIGGMARAMMPHFEELGLTAAFREKRRVDLLEKDFSVTVVEDDFTALTGCAAYLAAQG